jgi:Na+-translocating ferredoxin:NAD+ oxidoreductase RNF subunit RnfB
MDSSSILFAAATLGGVGLTFGGLIALAHSKLRVWEDPRIDGTEELLPGSNCGGCGQPGCRAFAESLVTGDEAPAACTQLDVEHIAIVAAYLGVAAGEANKRVARLLCAGGSDVALVNADYHGLSTCEAAAAVAGGGKACTWGCLGLGDCARVCDYDAITMTDTALPNVTPALCTACNDCVEVCPKDLFTLMPVAHHLVVQCKSLLEGDEAEALCEVACNACGKCALDADEGVITMENGLPVVHYEHHERAAPDATGRCPTGAIVWLTGEQFGARAPRDESPQPSLRRLEVISS